MFLSISQSRPYCGVGGFFFGVAISHMVQQCVHQDRGSGGKCLNLKGCNSVNTVRTKAKEEGRGLAGLSVRHGGGPGGIGNVRVLRRTRIWKSQVLLKGKLLVVCRVAAAAPENKRKK